MGARTSPLGENIIRWMKIRGIEKDAELARLAKISPSEVSRIIGGDNLNPGIAKLEAIARALSIHVGYLLLGPSPQVERVEVLKQEIAELQQRVVRIGEIVELPSWEFSVLASVPGGLPETPSGDIIDQLRFHKKQVAIRVSGESMIDVGIHPGDIIILDTEQQEPRNGQIAVVRLARFNEVTVKQFFREDDHVRLEPANSKYKAIRARDVEVLGVVAYTIQKRI